MPPNSLHKADSIYSDTAVTLTEQSKVDLCYTLKLNKLVQYIKNFKNEVGIKAMKSIKTTCVNIPTLAFS